MQIRFLFFLVSLLTISTLSAQQYTTVKTVKGKTKKQFQKAKEYAFNREYPKALRELDKIIEDNPTFIDAVIDRAELHYDQKRYAQAEVDFERALSIAADYNARVYYVLALAEMKQDKYLEAAANFELYANNGDSRNEKRKARALRYRDTAFFLEKAMKNPVPYNPQRLSSNINTDRAEYLPTFTADGETLIYTARVPAKTQRGDYVEQEDFYMSTNVDGEWQKGEPITDINTPLSEGAQSISADGRFLVFTGCNRRDGYGSCDIYFSEKKNGRWTRPENIGSPINTGKWESLPSLSADGQLMYFTSDRPGGLGGKDIYLSQRQANGSWSKPQNIGDKINTPEDDQNPFFHPDGETLYFMSKGHPGIGNYDLYVSRKDENGEWQKPKNLGFPINTKGNEGALTISLDGKTAYFASDQSNLGQSDASAFDSGRSVGGTDIYSFELYPEARPQPVTYVKAKVRDANTKKDLVAQVEFIDLKTNQIHTASSTNEKGEFLVVLPMGKDYALNVSKQKYLFHSENFALAETSSLTEPYLLNIDLVPIAKPTTTSNTPIAKAKPIILKNVFFATASAELLDASLNELQRLKTLLVDNPNLNIQINGHTDNVGQDADNQTLSTNRAKAVYNYLIENGIAESRLKYKGFGESQPIDTNETKEGRQRNRRTEFEAF